MLSRRYPAKSRSKLKTITPFPPMTRWKNSITCSSKLNPSSSSRSARNCQSIPVWLLGQIQQPAIEDDDRVFDDLGLFVEVLTLDYETAAVHLSGGKMAVNFGTAWDATPGVYGTDLAEEHEMAENIGLLAS